MVQSFVLNIIVLICFNFTSNQVLQAQSAKGQNDARIRVGAMQTGEYLPMLKSKKIGVVANHTSTIGYTHLVDSLISAGIDVIKVFSPEHGFRGDAADGAHIENSIDSRTGIPIISLYGNQKKPSESQMKGIDIMLFDIQDVGVRFYTYISTLTYIMEACAEQKIQLIVLDRPNPNGFYVDGPVLEANFSSFVGLHCVPVVYGLTIGEYASMVNGEKWLNDGVQCKLKVVTCQNYTHDSLYVLPIKPSPNLPTMNSIYLYPSLCFFEGTVVSVGRGTKRPFEIAGHPKFSKGSYTFVPQPIKGVSDNPPLKGQECKGIYYGAMAETIKNHKRLELQWLLDFYNDLQLSDKFFTSYFEKLAGTNALRRQIMQKMKYSRIRESWKPEIDKYMKIRSKYLLYPDFSK